MAYTLESIKRMKEQQAALLAMAMKRSASNSNSYSVVVLKPSYART
jgi:hypothetical protein